MAAFMNPPASLEQASIGAASPRDETMAFGGEGLDFVIIIRRRSRRKCREEVLMMMVASHRRFLKPSCWGILVLASRA